MDSVGKRVLFGLCAGVSIAASSLMLYLLYKNDDEDEEGYSDRNKSQSTRNVVTTSRQTVAKILVPQEVIGAIIGRKGETIKGIQTETKTRINFDDNVIMSKKSGNNDWNDDGNENGNNNGNRTIIIRGTPEAVIEAENIINRMIAFQLSIKTEEILVPQACVGYIIGKKGSTVRQIASETKTEINVITIPNKKSDLVPIRIKGAPDAIKKAVSQIDEIIGKHTVLAQNMDSSLMNKQDISGSAGSSLLPIEAFKLEEVQLEKHFIKLEPTDESGLVPILVSAVKSPHEFWVQLAGEKALKLDQLMDETTDLYEKEEFRNKMKPDEIKIGDILVAPYAHDEHYYRVKVISIHEDNYSPEESQVRVYYLDYGDEADIKRSDLYLIKEELIRKLLFQAVECGLSGVSPKYHIDWSQDSISAFCSLTYAAQWKTIYAKPVETRQLGNGRSRYMIQLFDENIDLANQMISLEHAIASEESEQQNVLNGVAQNENQIHKGNH